MSTFVISLIILLIILIIVIIDIAIVKGGKMNYPLLKNRSSDIKSWRFDDIDVTITAAYLEVIKNGAILKMVPFYGTVYKSSLYDLIIPFPACESGAEREKRRAIVFASGKTGKSE